jgi:hypothetical protein
MTPVRAQNDKCESVAIASATKRLLHIGKRICRWLEQMTIRVRFGSPGITNDEAQAYY